MYYQRQLHACLPHPSSPRGLCSVPKPHLNRCTQIWKGNITSPRPTKGSCPPSTPEALTGMAGSGHMPRKTAENELACILPGNPSLDRELSTTRYHLLSYQVPFAEHLRRAVPLLCTSPGLPVPSLILKATSQGKYKYYLFTVKRKDL